MKGLQYATVLLVLTVIAFWVVYEVEPPPRPPDIRVHTVGFDNRYGSPGRLPVYVTVDNRAEQALTATCDPTTCSFELALTDAPHEILISVEHGGRRSAPARVALDTRISTNP
jgi:hypothetical protein